VLRVGSPGSLVGVSFSGVGVETTSPGGVGNGDESGVWGKACIPASGVDTGEPAGAGSGDESGVCGKACSRPSGLATGDGEGTCPWSGRLTARYPSAIKRLFTGTNLLVGILVQLLGTSVVSGQKIADDSFWTGTESDACGVFTGRDRKFGTAFAVWGKKPGRALTGRTVTGSKADSQCEIHWPAQ
jgi:hypothetical protein